MEEPFYRIVFILQSIFILVSIIAFSKWRELSHERKLRDLVSWSVTGGYCPALGVYSYTRELIDAVLRSQNNSKIEEEFKITKECDMQYLRDIIEEYQKHIARSYFLGSLELIKSKYEINDIDFFMMHLCAFLEQHCNDSEFIGHSMYSVKYILSGDNPSVGSDKTRDYGDTNFAILYFKLYNIAFLYCKNSVITNPSKSPYWKDWEEKTIKTILDSSICPEQ